MADGKSGGSKPLQAGGHIPLAGVVLAALPTQASRRSVPASTRAQKTHPLTEVGTACRGVSTLLGTEFATAVEGCQDRLVANAVVHDMMENLTLF